MNTDSQRNALDSLYAQLNRRKYVSPDPLQFLYEYEDICDREIVGIIASSLAIGKVRSINASISAVLSRIGKPYEFVMNSERNRISDTLCGLKHRWTTCEEMASLLSGVKQTIADFGSLNKAFLLNYKPDDETTFDALDAFGALIARNSGIDFQGLKPHPRDECKSNRLIAIPAKGSASKRWHLYLRWMVRKDDVDPGGWTGVPASKLVVPMDTHMGFVSRELGFTERSVTNRTTALEVTQAFTGINPNDPVKYDFSLTRLGIRNEMSFDNFLTEWKAIARTQSEKVFEATIR